VVLGGRGRIRTCAFPTFVGFGSVRGRVFRRLLAELPARESLQELQAAQCATDHPLVSRHTAERHELPAVRSVLFDDTHERDVGLEQSLRNGLERGLVRHAEHDGDRVLGQVARRRVAGSVGQLRSERAEGQVAANDQEVAGRRWLLESRRYVNRFSVGTKSA